MVKKVVGVVLCILIMSSLLCGAAKADEAWAAIGIQTHYIPENLDVEAYVSWVDVVSTTHDGPGADVISREHSSIADPQSISGAVKVYVTNTGTTEYTSSDRPQVRLSILTETELTENGDASASMNFSGELLGIYSGGGLPLYTESKVVTVSYAGTDFAIGQQKSSIGSFTVEANGGTRY